MSLMCRIFMQGTLTGYERRFCSKDISSAHELHPQFSTGRASLPGLRTDGAVV